MDCVSVLFALLLLPCVSLIANAGAHSGIGRSPADLGNGAEVRSLAGLWRFSASPSGPLTDSICLPGTSDEAGKDIGVAESLPEQIHPMLLGAEEVGRLTKHLRRRHPFVGVARYAREIEIPQEWKGRRITLVLERTKSVMAVLDGKRIGASDTLATPAVIELPFDVAPGCHTLELVVDNRMDKVPVSGHQIAEDTQTNWNGILGEMSLSCSDVVEVLRLDPYPDAAARRVKVRVVVRNDLATNVVATCRFRLSAPGVPDVLDNRSFSVVPGVSTNHVVVGCAADAPIWSEFSPVLHTLEASLAGYGRRTVRFGLRDFKVKGTQFTVNGRPTFLRGRHDACVWPKTGYAPMAVGPWRKYFDVLKAYGLNHVRCHSWCPPEAAFVAADEAGFYLQPEFAAFGGDFAGNDRFRAYVRAESRRILDVYGHHPSFCLYTLSNEPTQGRDERVAIVDELKEYDPRHLYAQGSNADYHNQSQAPCDDFWSTFRSAPGAAGNARGSFAMCDRPLGAVQVGRSGTWADFSSAVGFSTVPIIGHEVGQYQVYPDFKEIEKYDGVLRAVNYEVFSNRLCRAGMGEQAEDFFRASGALAVINYREEIEEAIRTPGFGGFQLLDLQDFPGQGTALVGILNAFLESKGFIKPESWREFCAPTVLLARFARYTYVGGERFRARLQVAHYGREDSISDTVRWQVVGGTTVHARGETRVHARVGTVSFARDEVTVDLPRVDHPEKLVLELSFAKRKEKTSYPLWLYPASQPAVPSEIVETDNLKDAERLLSDGKKVLCVLARGQAPTNSVEGAFASDFWNWQMFRQVSKSTGSPVAPGTLGLLIRPDHPAFSGFPTASHSDYQWRELLLNGVNVVLDDDPSAELIVQGIDNVYRNHRLGVVWEKRRGRGHLIVCALDLNRVIALPEARALKASLAHALSAAK